MKTNIAIEAEAFLRRTGFSARKLAIEAQVNPVILTRVIAGKRKDMTSTNADKLRDAMLRLSEDLSLDTSPRQQAQKADSCVEDSVYS